MDFGLSADQTLLEESVRGYLRDRVPITRVRELRDLDCPDDRGLWKDLADLGVAGILVPEAHGGSGLGLLEAALVAQALGHAATPAPFLSSAVMAAIALREVPGEPTGGWLRDLASGDLVIGVGVTETFSVREGAGLRLDGDTLAGKTLMALDAHGADLVLLAVGDDRLVLVRADAPGLATTRLTTIDRTRCTAELVCDGVRP